MAGSVIFFVVLYQRRVLQNKLQVQELQVQHQEDMLKATLTSQEKERAKVGTELHDEVGVMLSTIKMGLQMAKKPKFSTGEKLEEVLGQLDETIQQVRGLSHQMMPVVLKKYGLSRAIDEFTQKVNKMSPIEVRMDKMELPVLDDEQALMFYRIVQELINNAIKHSKAEHITLSSEKVNGIGYRFAFVDDGVGFPAELLKNADGMGLWNIRNRAQVLKSQVIFANGPQRGAQIILEMPTIID